MKKLPVLLVGLSVVVVSCAPVAAPTPLAESPTAASPPTAPVEAQGPAATATIQDPTATTASQDPPATATIETLDEAAIAAPTSGGRNFQPQLEQISIDLNEVVTLLPPDAIPAVSPARAEEIMVTAAEADAAGIDPNVQVIGVEINGESRAYPIPYMSAHEIVNDVVGGRRIAATW